MSATQNAINLLDTLNKTADMKNEVQSSIANDVFFKRCSVNLLIGKRGSGKTFNVLREILKLNWIKDNGGFSAFLYVSPKGIIKDASVLCNPYHFIHIQDMQGIK